MLARILGGYGIKSVQVRCGDKTLKGYRRADFYDQFLAYLPDSGTDLAETEQAKQTEQASDYKEPAWPEAEQGAKPTEPEDDVAPRTEQEALDMVHAAFGMPREAAQSGVQGSDASPLELYSESDLGGLERANDCQHDAIDIKGMCLAHTSPLHRLFRLFRSCGVQSGQSAPDRVNHGNLPSRVTSIPRGLFAVRARPPAINDESDLRGS